MPINYVPTFAAPSEYERQMAEARRRQAMAEALEAQAYRPLSGSDAPTPAAAPLVAALQSFMSARQRKKAMEAATKAEEMESTAGRQIAGRLRGGYVYDPKAAAPAEIPEQTTLEEFQPTSQYRRDPEDAMNVAMTPVGTAALRRAPMLAAALERSITPANAEEFYAPTETEDGLVQFGKRGGKRETGYKPPPKTPESTTTQRDYEFARSQGYQGSFEDFRRASTPSTVVNLDTKGNQLGQELYLKKIDSLEAPARNAGRILNQVNAMDKATQEGTFKGSMAPTAVGAAQFLDSFGIKIKPEVLANTRAFQAASNQLVLDFMAANGGARGFTEKETAILQDAFPKIVDSPDARKQIADLLRNRALQDVEDYNFAIGEFGKTFPNVVTPYKPIDNEEIRYQRWRRSQGGG